MQHVLLTSLSLAAILALQGCGGGDKYKASSTTSTSTVQTSYVQKDGLSGVVLANTYLEGATVCFDIDKDGTCDSNEPSEKTYENGKFSFSAYQTSKGADAPMLALYNNELVLTAVQKSSNQTITPFTSLAYSDQIFNPNANAENTEAINQLVAGNANLNRNWLEGYDYLESNPNISSTDANEITSSFKKAYDLNNSQPLESIANVADEVVKQQSFDINITTLASQTRYDPTLSATLEASTSISSQDGNQRGVDLASSSSRAIVHSKWNNKLSVYNISATSPSTLQSNNYLQGVNGTVDTSSSASEQVLSKLLVSSSNDHLYSMIKKDKVGNDDNGLGIYHSSFDANSVPSLAYYTYTTSATNFYAHTGINDIALSADNTKLAAATNTNTILLFSATDLSTPTLTISTLDAVYSLAFSSDGSYIYAGVGSSSPELAIYNATSGAKLGSLSRSTIIKQVVPISTTNVLLSFNDSTSIELLDVNNTASPSLTRTFTCDSNVNDISLSSDNKRFLASLSGNKKRMNAFLVSDESSILRIDALADINGVGFSSDTKAFGVSDATLYTYSITGEGSSPTTAQKTAWTTAHRN